MKNQIEVIKDMYAAFGRGDVEGILAHLADDVVWAFEATDPIAWAGVRHGKQETAGFFAGINEQLSDCVLSMTEFLDDGDRVASFGRFQATVRDTAKHVDTPAGHFFRLRDGKVVEYWNFVNSAAFLEAMAAEPVHK